MVDYYLRIAEAAGCPPESQQLELATVLADEQSADGVWARLGLRENRVVLLNCSGAYGASKLWPSEHFGQLARRIADELEHDVLVMCGPKETGIAREVMSVADHPRVFSMAEQPLDLGTAKACIRRGRLMVSTDSGPRHVAAAFGKPVITLYGPMLPIWAENPTQEAVNLILPLDCVGCRKRVCPLGHHRCMQDMKPDLVYAEVNQMLNKDRSACAA
jgi:heptosyltransferase-2